MSGNDNPKLAGVPRCCCLLMFTVFSVYLFTLTLMAFLTTEICDGIMPSTSFAPGTIIHFTTTGFGPDTYNLISYTDPKCEQIFAKCSSNCNAASSAGKTFANSMSVAAICALIMVALCLIFGCVASNFGSDTVRGCFGGVLCLLGVGFVAFVVSLIAMTIAFGTFNTHTPCTDTCLIGSETNNVIIVTMVFGWVLCSCCCCLGISTATRDLNGISNATRDLNGYQQLSAGSGGGSHIINVRPQNDDGPYKPASPNVRRRMVNALRRTNPSGQTAFYDATILGLTRMLDLREEMMRGRAPDHKFIQIVLTDGVDSQSQSSLQDVCQIMGRLRGFGLDCRTIFVGVNTSYSINQQFRQLKNLGGDNVEFHVINNTDIESIFERIEVSIGIHREALGVRTDQGLFVVGQESAELNVGMNFFAVQFLLDISGSMSGSKWRRVCNSVDAFMSHLTEQDLVSCVIFNDNARFLSF